MDQSAVFDRIHFLRELGKSEKTTRQLLVRYMTAEQIEALSEVVRYIVVSSISVLRKETIDIFANVR